MNLLAETRGGRDINRHYYRWEEVQEALLKPVVQDLFTLIRFRNENPAFQGLFSILSSTEETLILRWENAETWAQLKVDFVDSTMEIRFLENETENRLDFKTTRD